MVEYLNIRKDELAQEYRERLYRLKVSGERITWKDLATLIGNNTGEWKDESTWRREAHRYVNKLLEMQQSVRDEIEDIKKAKSEVEDAYMEYQKERVKITDVKTQIEKGKRCGVILE